MEKIILSLSYGTVTLYDLELTWLQPKTMSPGWMLCYRDAKYERGIIYRSSDKKLLLDIQDEMMTAISEGKKLIKL